MSKCYKQVIDKLLNSKSICIISHINPDGDNIGSTIGLGMGLLSSLHGKVVMAKSDTIPSLFSFLPGVSNIREINKDEKFDVLIALDCSDQYRLGEYQWIINNSDCVINIDHHISNNNFGDINIIESNASSTGEIVYKLLSCMKIKITKEIATCLYVAISTDTGSFKYDNTSSLTHKIASDLLDCNIDLNEITRNIYQSRSLSKTKLLISCLNSLRLYNENKIAIVSITKNMLEKSNSSTNDADGIIDFIRDIDTVEVACVLKEIHPLEVKVGFRSKKYVDVAKIAESFEGGGHKRASGCTVKSSIEKTEKHVLEKILKTIR